jgi:hypothetical protein
MDNHQNSYRFVTKFTEVFSCVFLHGYYDRGICTDLSFKPTAHTKLLIKNYNLIFKLRPGGFVLAVNSDKDFSNLIYKEPFELDFEFKFTNPHFFSITVLLNNPEIRYLINDNLESSVQLGALEGVSDPLFEKPGLSGIMKVKHDPNYPILPLVGGLADRFVPRSKQVLLENRWIRPVYICYGSEETIGQFEGMTIENEGEFKGKVEFDPPQLITTDSGLIGYKFIAKQDFPMKSIWKGYFKLSRTNQLGVYKKTLPNPSPQSIKFDPSVNSYISENFVKL